MGKIVKRLSSAQIIILGFAGVILFGSLLLMLPFSTQNGQGAAFTDALFTSTSAVCVTGLVVRDTATYWTGFGQAVILMLIQIGGMGGYHRCRGNFYCIGKEDQSETAQHDAGSHIGPSGRRYCKADRVYH